MGRPRVLILRAPGTNCDLETQHAWTLAGAVADRVHLARLIERPATLDEYQICTIPGGFSYGDDIAAGRIFAAQLRGHLAEALQRFVERGGLVLGICNGFQILVQAGLLPGNLKQRCCSMTRNDPPIFQDRWVTLRANDSPCVFLEPGREYEMPIANGEGRVVFDRPESLERLESAKQNALLYIAGETVATAAGNPNGSAGDIAGICDPTGRVFGLMPHPERFVTGTQHPCWTSRPPREDGDGLAMFQRAVAQLS